MATHKSAVKAHKQNMKRRERNRQVRSRFRGQLKAVRDVLASGDAGEAQGAVPGAVSLIDRMAAKGIIHRNTASRYKARLAKRLASLTTSG